MLESLTLQAPSPQNVQTHSNNFEFDYFVGRNKPGTKPQQINKKKIN